MSRWLLLLLVALSTAPALASVVDADVAPPAKAPVAAKAPTQAERDAAEILGGDTFANALPIVALPFTGSGTTVGYHDDYDNDCGSGLPGTAPDVVYAFTAPADGFCDLDLCGSEFDTKLYVYDAGLSLVACNDDLDYSLPPGDHCYYDSFIDSFPVVAGQTYYFVIDGFSADAGIYAFAVSPVTACDVAVSAAVLQENEPPLAAGGNDAYNCGCTCAGVFGVQDLEADPYGRVEVDIVQGWRDFGIRDRDWFRLTAGAGGTVHVELESEVPSIIAVYDNATCEALNAPTLLNVAPCTPTSADVAVAPGAQFYIQSFVYASYPPLGLVPASFDAVLTATGLAAGVPVAPTPWGVVKSMYR